MNNDNVLPWTLQLSSDDSFEYTVGSGLYTTQKLYGNLRDFAELKGVIYQIIPSLQCGYERALQKQKEDRLTRLEKELTALRRELGK